MSDELLRKATESTRKKSVPDFTVGDTVGVAVRIVEGDKERQQVFTGTVIGRKGGGASETFTVRRIVNNQGVERVFPIHSPRIADIHVLRKAKTRRAKLYYLRDRVGKATRLRQAAGKAAPKPQPPKPAGGAEPAQADQQE
ncbi:MAG: 50S ribosomal protein L19 [Planctomycetota bacterium]